MASCKRNCKYRTAKDTVAKDGQGCAYIQVTGRSRLAAIYEQLGVDHMTPEAEELLRPENCPFYKKGKRVSRERQGVPLMPRFAPSVDYVERWHGGEDPEGAEVPEGEVVAKPRRGRPCTVDHERALELYRQGLSDKKIADALGEVSDSAVRAWRLRNGLKANVPPIGGKARIRADGTSPIRRCAPPSPRGGSNEEAEVPEGEVMRKGEESVKRYRNGDRCPCCGQVIQGKDEHWLWLFSFAAAQLGLPEIETTDGGEEERAVEDAGPYRRAQ